MLTITVKKTANAGPRCIGLYAGRLFARLFVVHLGGLALLITGVSVTTSAAATPNETDRKTIEYLIEYIRASDMTFVRNFSKHASGEAASHILEKYAHFRNEIRTPEDFIELCATESLMTGRAYLVIDQQGGKQRSRDWLTDVLADYRNRQSRTATK